MATQWRKIANSETDKMWNGKDSSLQPEEMIEGTYVDRSDNIGENNSVIYVIKVGDERIGVWGSTVLDTRMNKLKIGALVKIVYKGLKPSNKRRGKNYHDYEVYEGFES